MTGNINLNSISSKFDQLKCLVEGNIDILFVTETVVDESFHTKQFIDGFSKTYWLDRNQKFVDSFYIFVKTFQNL